MTELALGDRGARELDVVLAHQLADQLHLPSPRFVGADAARGPDRIDQRFGEAERSRPGRRAARAALRLAPAGRARPACGVSCWGARAPLGLEVLGRWGAKKACGPRWRGGRRYHSRGPCADRRERTGATPHLPSASTAPRLRRRRVRASGFAYSRDQFRELVETCLATAKTLGRERCRRRGLGRRRPVGLGAQGRDREHRAQSRQVDQRHGLRRPAARQREHVRLLACRDRADRSCRARHRPLHRRRSRGRPARRSRPRRQGRLERSLDLFHPWSIDAAQAIALATRCEAAALAVDRRITNSEGAGVSAQQRHFYAGNTRGFGAGYASSRHALSVAPIASLPGTLGRRDAARRLVHVDARARGSRRAGSGRALCRRARALAPRGAEDQDLRGAGAVRVVARLRPARRLRAGDERRRALPKVDLPDRQPGSARAARAHRHPRGSARPARQGQRAVRRRRRDDEGRADRRGRRRRQLLPVVLFGAQARHAHDRPRRRLAQPLADVAPAPAPATISKRCSPSSAAASS